MPSIVPTPEELPPPNGEPIFSLRVRRGKGFPASRLGDLRAAFPALRNLSDQVLTGAALGPPTVDLGRFTESEMGDRQALLDSLHIKVERIPVG